MIEVRHLEESDYDALRASVVEWADGAQVLPLFPRHVLRHFRDTQFVAVRSGALCGVISGFHSQSFPDEAYVRVIAIASDLRGAGAGRALYERFFEAARARGCRVIRAITSPENRISISFHRALGFEIEPGDCTIEDVSAHRDYASPGQHRVLMVRQLDV